MKRRAKAARYKTRCTEALRAFHAVLKRATDALGRRKYKPGRRGLDQVFQELLDEARKAKIARI